MITVAFSAVLLMELWTHPIIPVLTKWLENVAFSEFFEAMLRMVGTWEVQLHKEKCGTWNTEGTRISSQHKLFSLFLSKKEARMSVDLMA